MQNIVQSLMNLVLSSKSDRKWPKMSKTKTVRNTTYIYGIRGLRVNSIKISYKKLKEFRTSAKVLAHHYNWDTK